MLAGLSAVNAQTETTAKCFSCNVQWDQVMTNAEMWDECQSSGTSVECKGDASACSTLERQSNTKQIMMIEMGCKQKKACLVNKL